MILVRPFQSSPAARRPGSLQLKIIQFSLYCTTLPPPGYSSTAVPQMRLSFPNSQKIFIIPQLLNGRSGEGRISSSDHRIAALHPSLTFHPHRQMSRVKNVNSLAERNASLYLPISIYLSVICDLLPHQAIVTKVLSSHKGQTEETQPDKARRKCGAEPQAELSEVNELRLHGLACHWGPLELF